MNIYTLSGNVFLTIPNNQIDYFELESILLDYNINKHFKIIDNNIEIYSTLYEIPYFTNNYKILFYNPIIVFLNFELLNNIIKFGFIGISIDYIIEEYVVMYLFHNNFKYEALIIQNLNYIFDYKPEIFQSYEFIKKCIRMKYNIFDKIINIDFIINNRNIIIDIANNSMLQYLWNYESVKSKYENDFEIMLSNIFTLSVASESLKDNEEFILESINRGFNGIRYASKRLKNDRDFILKTIKLQEFMFASEELNDDKELVDISIINNVFIYRELPNSIKKDLEIAKYCISKDPLLILDAPLDIQKNKEIQNIIKNNNSNLLKFI